MDVIWEILLLIYSRKPHPNTDLSVYRSDDPDPEYEVSLDLAAIKLKISGAKAECCRRRMGQTAKWLAEISFAIRETKLPQGPENLPQNLPPSFTSTLKNVTEHPFLTSH